MGIQQRKAAKLVVRSKDQLRELPDEILSTIISSLPLKEAVRTSVLSRRWKYIWTYHTDLWFDSVDTLGSIVHFENTSLCKFKLDRQEQRCKFVERVDKIMHQLCQSAIIKSLTLHFHLSKEFSFHIDQWISSAVMKGVEIIDLDLSEWHSFSEDHISSTAFKNYELCSRLLAAPGRKCTLKHLRLDSCTLSVPRSSKCMTFLITIELRCVCISDQTLENLLSNCLLLERLSLHLCKDLVNLNFTSPSLHLKFLSIEGCFRLEKIKISAENLVRFEYTGPLINFSFKHAPKLAEAFLNFTGESRVEGVTYALTKFASELPQLEKLNLFSLLAMKALKLPENGSKFTNIKQLLLTICPFDDEDRLCWLTYILKAFPLLQKLQLNLFSPSFIKQPKEIERLLPECPHMHLTEVEINGFYDNQHEVELLKYLLENLVALKELAIGPCQKVYKGFNDWTYEEASSLYRLRQASVSKWLQAEVPPTVNLEVR